MRQPVEAMRRLLSRERGREGSPAAGPSAEAAGSRPAGEAERAYGERVDAEMRFFRGAHAFDALPQAFHYWTNRYLRPEVQRVFGTSGPVPIFVRECAEAIERTGVGRIASLGVGKAETEIQVAQGLLERGFRDFELECLEITPALCEAGRKAAERAGVGERLVFVEADVNRWTPTREGGYAAIVANQILHHVVELEGLFAAMRAALAPRGRAVTRDMMGRNGHRCWPEMRAVVDEIWASLPERLRYDHRVEAVAESYPDRDCSTEGFEGIRAQDVLPLLLRDFHFLRFIGFGGLVERFTGRAFGHNFRVEESDGDRLAVDLIYAMNRQLIDAGAIKPTQLVATFGLEPTRPECGFGWTPEWCLRHPDA